MLLSIAAFGLGVFRAPWWSPIIIAAISTLLRVFGPQNSWREQIGLAPTPPEAHVLNFFVALAFCYVAFGIGWLISRLFISTRRAGDNFEGETSEPKDPVAEAAEARWRMSRGKP